MDDNGHYQTLSVHFRGKLDLTTLPPAVTPSDVWLTHIDATIMLSAIVQATLITAPQSRYFKQDHNGLKEYIEGLLAQTPGILEALAGLIKQLDDMATDALKPKQPVDGSKPEDGARTL